MQLLIIEMLSFKDRCQQASFLKYLKRLVLFVFAFIIFSHNSVLFIQQSVAKEPRQTAIELSIEGKQLYEQGKFDLAAKVWQQAANIYAELEDEQNKNQSLINVAEALQANGRYFKACDAIVQTLNIEQFDCRSLITQTDSDRLFDSWLDTFPLKPFILNRANALHSFGDILQKLGRIDLSDRVLIKALKIARQFPSSQHEGAILLSLGNNQQLLGDRKQNIGSKLQQQNNLPLACPVLTDTDAIPFYQKTLTLYEEAANKVSSPDAWIKIQLNRLSVLSEIGAKSQALELAETVLPKLEHLSTALNTVPSQINLAKNLICLNQNLTAIAKILETAVKQAQNLEDRRNESYALGYLGWLYQQNRQYAQALSFTKQALFQAETIQAKDIAYKWQWQLGYLQETQGNLPDAVAAYSEAVDLLQSLRQNLIAVQTETQFYFQRQVEPVYRKLVELLLKTQDNPSSNQNNLQQARQTIESLRLVELENFLQKACLNPKIQIDRIIDQANSTTAVIYPIILQDRLAIILKLPRKKELRYYTTVVSQEELAETIYKLESYLSDITRTFQVNQLAQQVYDWLISPLEKDLENSEIETLVFVPDKFFRNIPISVLYDKENRHYLIEKYAIAIAPSLQLIDSKSIDNSAIKVLAAGISKKQLVEDREFTSLNSVPQELLQIRSKVAIGKELIDSKFTKINLQKQLKNNSFSVIHLATHGQFSSNLNQTYILVWEQLLRIEDLVNLFQIDQNVNSIKLLVLSACQTAKGDPLAPLGLAGITVRTGVQSTLATLWSVDDFSTTQMIERFYEELKNGLTNAKAIQKAQLAILEKEKRPYFWAPFILVGNWL